MKSVFFAQPLAVFSVSLMASNGPSTSDTFVHLFEWKWTDIAQECEDYLGPMGFKAVQTSPQMEHIKGDPWWTRYQPVSYKTVSRSGNEADFTSMVKRCAAVGVGIIADPVPNHMAGGSGTGVAGSSFGGRAYPGLYSANDFHHNNGDVNNNCQVNNYQDKVNVQHCDLSGLTDLDTGADYVQTALSGYFKNLLNLGVAGFRIDAAKHQDAGELGSYLAKVGKPWNFQEVIWGQNEAVEPEQYTGNGLVSEFRWALKVGNDIKNGNMGDLYNAGDGILGSSQAVNFLDNHDTQRGGAPITYKDGDTYRIANYFMLAHPYGVPKVMSSYYFDSHDQGPPSQNVHDGGNVHCFSGNPWVCEHRWQGVGAMVAFRKTAGSSPVSNWNANGNKLSFSRGSVAFIAINQGGDNWQTTVKTGLPGGDYCDIIGAKTSSKVPFYSSSSSSSSCDPNNRVDCGHAGTTQQQCEASGCCWQPTTNSNSSVSGAAAGVPWCFYQSGPPTPTPPPIPGKGCNGGKVVTVNGDGTALIIVGARTAVALHVNARP